MKFVEFAEFNEETTEYREILGETFAPDQRYKEDTIVDKIRNKEIYKPKFATHCRFLYGSSLLNINKVSHYYKI